MNSKPNSIRKIVLTAALLAVALPAFADRDEGHRGGGERGGERGEWRDHDRGEWRGGEMRHFDDHEWRGGRWVHDWHDGRLGWWWFVGGAWYFYAQPVYPYPEYSPPAVVVAPPAQPAPAVVAPQTTAQVWYYCEASKGYYPYVRTCPSGWKTVAPTPPTTPSVPPDLQTQSR